MLEKILENLLSTKQWIRIALMLFFALISWLVRFVQILIAIVQALCVLIAGEENERLRTAGMVSSIYQAQIWLFLTYASDSKPFPLSDLPGDINDLDLNKDDVMFTYPPAEEAQKDESEDDVFSDMSFTSSEVNSENPTSKPEKDVQDDIPTLDNSYTEGSDNINTDNTDEGGSKKTE